MGLNHYELMTLYTQDETIPQKSDLFALSSLMRGLRTDTYEIPEAIVEKVHLTEYGETTLTMLKKIIIEDEGIHECDYYDFLLRKYSFVELFIDAEKTDHEWLKNTISEMVLSGQLRYPWVYGRQLYDKFAADDRFTPVVSELNSEDTTYLLENTFPGVFQMGKYVIGPYGVIESKSRRSIYFRSKIELWHCSDPGCPALHEVQLKQPNDNLKKLNQAWPRIKSMIFPNETESQWTSFLDEYLNRENEAIQQQMLESGYIRLSDRPSEDYSYRSIPALMHSLFSERECIDIFVELMGSNRDRIISSLDEGDTKEFLMSGGWEKLAKLSISKLFQIALLYSEEEIVRAIERCIDDGRIVIPGTEKRAGLSPRTGKPILASLNVHHPSGQNHLWPFFNKYGLTLSGRKGMDLMNLRRILQQLLQDESHQTSLEFMLEEYEGNNIREQMDNMLLKNTPREIVKDIFMRNKKILSDCINLLPVGNYPDFSEKFTSEQREYLSEKILWKLGFDNRIEEGSLGDYMLNHKKYMDYLDNTSPNETEWERNIRGYSSNYFSSLEQVIEDSIIYITWAFMKDHFADAHFRFPRKDARVFCESIHADFDSSGENVLSTLVHLFSKLSDMISKLRVKGDTIRPGEMPHWNKKGAWSPLLMTHKHLCLDLSDASIDELIADLKDITRRLTDANVFHIRNRTTAHKNLEQGPFPTKEEIIICVSSIQKIFTELMIPRGLIDVPFMFSEETQSAGTYDTVIVRNGLGDALSLKCDDVTDTWNDLYPLNTEWGRFLILNGYRFRDSFTPIRFLVIEDSEFDSMWDNYPIRVERRRQLESDEM